MKKDLNKKTIYSKAHTGLWFFGFATFFCLGALLIVTALGEIISGFSDVFIFGKILMGSLLCLTNIIAIKNKINEKRMIDSDGFAIYETVVADKHSSYANKNRHYYLSFNLGGRMGKANVSWAEYRNASCGSPYYVVQIQSKCYAFSAFEYRLSNDLYNKLQK